MHPLDYADSPCLIQSLDLYPTLDPTKDPTNDLACLTQAVTLHTIILVFDHIVLACGRGKEGIGGVASIPWGGGGDQVSLLPDCFPCNTPAHLQQWHRKHLL